MAVIMTLGANLVTKHGGHVVDEAVPAPGQSKPLDDFTLLKVPRAHVLEAKKGTAW